MSSNNSTATAPHAHLLGAQVTLTESAKAQLEIDWVDGVIATAFETPRGVGIHVCNKETGEITGGITLDAVKFHPDTVKLIVSSGELIAGTMEATKKMLEEMSGGM